MNLLDFPHMSPADTTAAPPKSYHHGDLPAALRAATAELITERGPTGFSLREVARRAGVSHAAPAHHFGSSKGLLTSVATEGFQTLVDAFTEVFDIEDPVERLRAMGKAYVNTAVDYPGHFGVMCADELIDDDDPDFVDVATGSYQMLLRTIADIADRHNPDLDVDAAATLTWSAVHGLAVLSPNLDNVAEKNNTRTGPLDQIIDQFTELFMNGFDRRD